MKSIKNIEEKILSLINHWQKELENYNDEQFLRKPNEDAWSIGQVYAHLLNAAKNLQIKNINLCAEGKGEEVKGGKTIPGKLSFLLGMFPPVRIKVPASAEYTPKQPAGKEEVFSQFGELKTLIENIVHVVEKSSASIKTKHPALGYLNAYEWFRIMEMHLKHHLRQKNRLNKFLGVQ